MEAAAGDLVTADTIRLGRLDPEAAPTRSAHSSTLAPTPTPASAHTPDHRSE